MTAAVLKLGIAAFAVLASQLLLVLLAPGLTHASATTISAVLPLILLIAIPGMIALAATPVLIKAGEPPGLKRQSSAKTLFILAVALGALIRLVWFAAPPPIEDDYFRYLWDGAMLAHGFNPYAISPADIMRALKGEAAAIPDAVLTLARDSGDVLTRINFPELRSIYPGTAQAAFAVAHWLVPWSVTGLRAVFLSAEIATLVLLIAILRQLGVNPLWSALYWCNPFPAAMLIGAAHADVLIPPLLLGALLLAWQARYIVAGVLLALAAGVKVWPLLLAPLIFRPRLFNVRAALMPAAIFTLVLAAVMTPLLLSSLQAKSGLTAYAAAWSNNNGFFAWAAWWLFYLLPEGVSANSALRLAVTALAGGIALGAALKPASTLNGLLGRALVISAAVFYLAPAQFPWYAAPFIALAAALRVWPLLAASVLLPAYYLFFPLWQTGRGDTFIYGAAFIHSVPVFAWLIWRIMGKWLADETSKHAELRQ